MIGFKLNKETNDIEASGGKIKLLSTVQESVRQRLSIKLKTFVGEWFLDTTYGVPYRGINGIIGKGRTKAEVDAIFITIINEEPEVIRIKSFDSNYNPINRRYDLEFDVLVADRQLRIVDPSSTPNDEIEYTFTNTNLTSACASDVLSYSLQLHPILHDDLPEGGQYTWIRP